MTNQAAIVRAVVNAPTFDGVQMKLASIRNSLAGLALDGVDAVVTQDGPLLTSGAHSAVTRSEARYRHLINRMAAVLVELAPDGRILYLNEAIALVTGYSAGELRGRNWFDLLLPVLKSTSIDTLRQQFVENGELIAFRTSIRTRDGSRRFLSWSSAKVHDADGLVERLICLGTDVTVQVLAEQELRIAASAFQSHTGMIVTDARAVIVRVNQAFTRITGYSLEEAVGQTAAMLQSGRQDTQFYQRLWASLKAHGYWQGEIWNKRKNGHDYAEWLTITAVIVPGEGATHYVGTFTDITKDKEAEAEIHRLAYYDHLTQLPNRRALQDRLGQVSAASSRSGQCGAILFLDLDKFKTLNDTRGHDIGDLLLVEVARRLRTGLRESDTVARLGGDEFVVLLEDLGKRTEEAAPEAKRVAEKVLGVLYQPYNLEGYEHHCSASIGVALFCGQDKVEELLKHADLALYQAKTAGRNTLRFFDPAMQAALDARSALESDLRLALIHRQLRLYYQPQVDARGDIFGAETLLRWQHPQRGLVLPGEFISLAEDCGLILPIGLWVLETACAQLRLWQDDARACKLKLAVNVSARQFGQSDFVDQLRKILESSKANPTRLILELTESLVLENVEDSIAKMHALKRLGVGFSMDDFGTGYSSLSYLARLPLDQLKIDKSFVLNLPGSGSDGIIAQTIVTMGRSLGMNVIAEGVESEAQHAFLEQQGCHAYQGYLFGRPVPLEEFEQRLKQSSMSCPAIRTDAPAMLVSGG